MGIELYELIIENLIDLLLLHKPDENYIKQVENIRDLIKNTKIILKNSISLGGSSIKDFSNADGKNGNFQQKFNVYGREKNNCLTKGCSGVIKKIYVSNRSTFFCSYCQK